MLWLPAVYAAAFFIHQRIAQKVAVSPVTAMQISGMATLFAPQRLAIYLVLFTLVLLLLKKYRLLRHEVLSDLIYFLSGVYFGELFDAPILFGLIFLAGKKSEIKEITVAVKIFVAATVAAFIAFPLSISALYVAVVLLTVYDVLGVLIFKYIQKIWIEGKSREELERNGLVFSHGKIGVGAGDIIIPVAFSLKFPFPGALVPLFLFYFSLLLSSRFARRLGAFPGMLFHFFATTLAFGLHLCGII